MADPVLTPGEYSIGKEGSSAAFVYGMGTNNLQIQNTVIDSGTITVQDQAVVGHDGMVFGYDTMPGQTVTQTGFAMVSPGSGAIAMDAYSALAGVWNDPTIRLVDGAVQVLRAYYRGSNVVRRTYGRGRKIAPTMGQVFQGLVPFTAQFQSADNTWYSDTQYSLSLSMMPSFAGTLTPPLTPPYQLSSSHNYQQSTITNTGSLPTWPVFVFRGPVTNPSLTYVNTPVSIGYTGTLKSTDLLTIDTRPWARTAMLNGVTSVAGQLTGSAMISMQAQAGATLVRYAGQDPTGASGCTVYWRNATLMIGGSY